MKKIIFLLLILVSCQKEDINNSLSGTEWIGENEFYISSKTSFPDGTFTFTETTTVRNYTLKFTNETAGTIRIISIATTDGVASDPVNENYNFAYTYDPEFMRGSMHYDINMGENFQPFRSVFEIRSGFLYDDSDLTGEVEYRKK